MGFRIRVAAATLLALCSAFGPSQPATAAAPQSDEPLLGLGVPEPDKDPFYAVPTDVGRHPVGTVLRARPITAYQLALPLPAKAWQLLYVTSDAHEAPTATVATVLVPDRPWAGSGKRPLVSIQVAEDGLGTKCAPSYAFRAGLFAGVNNSFVSVGEISAALAKGWAVVVPDFEGPQSQFMVGPMAGHAVLDGIRAAKSYAPAGLEALTPTALLGYSGGAFATGWANELQPTYAPRLKLVGAATGGMPADVSAAVRDFNGGIYGGAGVAILISMNRAYPEAGLRASLNDAGRHALLASAKDCLIEYTAKYPFLDLSRFTAAGDLLARGPFLSLLRANSLGQKKPRTPIFEHHAIADMNVRIAPTDRLMARYCAQGTPVVYQRNPLGEHVTAAVTYLPAALAYLVDRFAGKPAPTNCRG